MPSAKKSCWDCNTYVGESRESTINHLCGKHLIERYHKSVAIINSERFKLREVEKALDHKDFDVIDYLDRSMHKLLLAEMQRRKLL